MESHIEMPNNVLASHAVNDKYEWQQFMLGDSYFYPCVFPL